MTKRRKTTPHVIFMGEWEYRQTLGKVINEIPWGRRCVVRPNPYGNSNPFDYKIVFTDVHDYLMLKLKYGV